MEGENEDHLGSVVVGDDDDDDDEWDGSECEHECEQDVFERRGAVWAGSRLWIMKRMHDE